MIRSINKHLLIITLILSVASGCTSDDGTDSGDVNSLTSRDTMVPVLESITVRLGTDKIVSGGQQSLGAVGHYDDATQKDLLLDLTWVSSKPDIAKVSSAGMVSAEKFLGNTKIHVTRGSIISAPVTINVIPALDARKDRIEVVTLERVDANVVATKSLSLLAYLIYTDDSQENVSEQVVWSSSNLEDVSINAQGLAESKTQWLGATTITAVLDGFESTLDLAVVSEPEATLAQLLIEPNDITMLANASKVLTDEFKVIAEYSDGSKDDVTSEATWTTSDETVLAVGSNQVTGRQAGEGVLKVAFSELETQATIRVNPILLEDTDPVPNINVMSIHIDPPNVQALMINTSQVLSVLGIEEGNIADIPITEGVEWESRNTVMATVDESGVVTAHQVGQVTIIAIVNDKFASVSITIIPDPTAVTLTAIQIETTDTAVDVLLGETTTVKATAIYSDTTTKSLTASSVTWQIDNETIASVDNGVVTPLSAGPVTVTASYQGVEKNIELMVIGLKQLNIDPVNPASVIDPLIALSLGETIELQVTATYTNDVTQAVSNDVTWSLSNTAIATLTPSTDKMLVTATQAGETAISVSLHGQTAQVNLTVVALEVLLERISISSSSTLIEVNTSQTYTVAGHYSDNTIQVITQGIDWSAASDLVTIDNGVVQAGATPGVVNIIATVDDNSAEVVLTVIDPTTNPRLIGAGVIPLLHTLVKTADYYGVNVIKGVTYDVFLDAAVADLDQLSLQLFSDSAFSSELCMGSIIDEPLFCQITANDTVVYLKVGSSVNREIDYRLRFDPMDSQDLQVPLDLGTAPVRHHANIELENNYYKTMVTPQRTYTISAKSLGESESVAIVVYRDSTFVDELCAGDQLAFCDIPAGLDTLYLRVDGSQAVVMSQYTLSVNYANEGSVIEDDPRGITLSPSSQFKGQVGTGNSGSIYWVTATKGESYVVALSGMEQSITVYYNGSTPPCSTAGYLASGSLNCLITSQWEGGFSMQVTGSVVGGTPYLIKIKDVVDSIYYIKMFKNRSSINVPYTLLSVFNTDDSQVYQDDGLQQGYDKLALPIPSGETVFIRVKDIGNLGGAYSIIISKGGFSSISNDGKEPNDPDQFESMDNERINATALFLNTRSHHSLSGNSGRFDDTDWFKFVAP